MKPLYELALLFIFVIILVILFKNDIVALLISEGLLLAFFGMVLWCKYEMYIERREMQQQQQAVSKQAQPGSGSDVGGGVGGGSSGSGSGGDEDEVIEFGYDPQYFPSPAQVSRAYNDNTTFTDQHGEVRCLGGMNDRMSRQLQIRSRRDEQNDIAASKMTADTFRKYFEPELVSHSNRCWWEDNPELEHKMVRDGMRFA